jgi:hypothetical protein
MYFDAVSPLPLKGQAMLTFWPSLAISVSLRIELKNRLRM